MSLLKVLNLRPPRKEPPTADSQASGGAPTKPAPPPRQVGDREAFVRDAPPPFEPPAASDLKGDLAFPRKLKGVRERDIEWFEAEALVHRKLEKTTRLTAFDKDAPEAAFLKCRPEEGRTAPITRPMLLKQPVITGLKHPDTEGKGRPLGSAQPDFLYLAPRRVEVIEVTLDCGFLLTAQLQGMTVSDGAKRRGSPHKQCQIATTLQHLIERFPDHEIVYNIQSHGELWEKVEAMLRLQIDTSRKQLAAAGKGGSVKIIWRGSKPVTFE